MLHFLRKLALTLGGMTFVLGVSFLLTFSMHLMSKASDLAFWSGMAVIITLVLVISEIGLKLFTRKVKEKESQ